LVVKAHPARKVDGLIAIPAVKIRKLVARNVNLVVAQRARKDQSILLAAQHQGHAANAVAASLGAKSPLRKETRH